MFCNRKNDNAKKHMHCLSDLLGADKQRLSTHCDCIDEQGTLGPLSSSHTNDVTHPIVLTSAHSHDIQYGSRQYLQLSFAVKVKHSRMNAIRINSHNIYYGKFFSTR